MIRERDRYQQLVNQELAKPKEQQQHEMISYYEARQLALKLLANAGYGAFARKEFAYSDYRVSEIITGYGRLIHKQMEKQPDYPPSASWENTLRDTNLLSISKSLVHSNSRSYLYFFEPYILPAILLNIRGYKQTSHWKVWPPWNTDYTQWGNNNMILGGL